MSVMALYLVALKLEKLRNNNTLFGERTWKYVSPKYEKPQVQCNNFPTFVFGFWFFCFLIRSVSSPALLSQPS